MNRALPVRPITSARVWLMMPSRRRAALRTAGSLWRWARCRRPRCHRDWRGRRWPSTWRCGGRGESWCECWRCRAEVRRPCPRSPGHRRETVAFLDAQLVEPAGGGAALRECGGDEQDRKLVNHARGERRVDFDAAELRMAHFEVGDPFAADGALVVAGDAGAHLAENLEDAGARGVLADVLDHD